MAETLDQLLASTAALAAVVEGLTDTDWELSASPRPLPDTSRCTWSPITRCGTAGCTSGTSCCRWAAPRPSRYDEVLTCLRYAAGLGRAFEVCGGRAEPGTVVLEVSDPAARLVVTTDADGVRVSDGAPPADAAVRPWRRGRAPRDAEHP